MEGQRPGHESALWGQEIGLKPVEDGIWAVYFEDLELGLFDERQGRVKPWPRLRNHQKSMEHA